MYRPYPVPEAHDAAVIILLEDEPRQAMQALALRSMLHETAGFLLSPKPEKLPDGRYLVHVTDSLPAEHTIRRAGSVTFTADTWRAMNDAIAARYPDGSMVMVSWVHTHPGYKIFLSEMDVWIHRHLFPKIFHTAAVLDPHHRTGGIFGWRRNFAGIVRLPFVWHWR
jgi:proteasome lid subunit RPN8/RPN11